MSLVNDMLKDLDQRRKGSENGSAAAKLTPASELPKPERDLRTPLLYGALAVAVLGLGFAWMQLNTDDGVQELNIRPQVSNESGQPEESPLPVENPEGNTAPAEAMSPVVQNPAVSAPGEPADYGDEPGVDSTAGDQLAEATTERIVSNDSPPPEFPLPVPPEPVVTAPEPPSRTVAIINQAPEESVKDSAQMTSEEADLRAVQDALRLIADNRNTEAYATLEQHILANRYAHQSRETYAKLLMNQGDTASSLALVDSGLQLAPNHAGYKKVKARLLMGEQRFAEAAELLLGRAPEISRDPEYHDLLASAQIASRDYQGASLSYRGLVQQNPNEGKWWYGFAASQDSLGNVRAARQGYSQAMQIPNLSANLRRRSQERLAALSQ